MASFRDASNKVMLNSVKTIKYDKNFNNWINPQVLKTFTKRSYKTAWNKSYDIGSFVYSDHAKCERICWRQLSKSKVSLKKSMVHLHTYRISTTVEKREGPCTAAPTHGNWTHLKIQETN